MKHFNITLVILFCITLANTMIAQVDTYKAEEDTYFTQLRFSSHDVLYSDNYSSGIYEAINGKSSKIITGIGSGRYYNVSPDGNWIGYKQINHDGSQQAIILNLNTKEKQILTYPQQLCGTPDFSENGIIAYSLGNTLFFGDSIKLGYHVNYIKISPNGKYIAFADNKEQITIIDTQTKSQKVISVENQAAFYPSWSPNSDKLVYIMGRDIYIYQLNTEETFIIKDGSAPFWFNNENLLFQRRDIDLDKLKFFNSDLFYCHYTGTKIKQLTNTPNIYEMNPISDGNYIYFHTYIDKQIIKAEFSPEDGIIKQTEFVKYNNQLPIEFDNNTSKSQRSIVYLGPVPYVHQKYDTPSWHNGSGSCAPTTCVMAFAYYNLLPPWEVSVDHEYSWDPHTNLYGSYVADKYRFNEIYYETYESAYGTDAWGGYGYMWDGDYSPGSRQRTYLENHYLTSNQLWLSSCTFDYTANEIDQDYVHPICSWITHSGHLTLAIGYVEGQHTLIFNDPWGNKNTENYPSYDGYDAYYDWPGYNNGYANLDNDGTHGGVAWTTKAQGTQPVYNDTIIDNNYYNHGFYANNSEDGSHQRYFHDTNAGYNGHFWWTGTMNTTNDWCYVTWTPNLSEAGDYEVFTYIPSVNATAQDAKYIITHDDGTNEVLINQSLYSDEWVSLGIYPFSPGNGGNVYLGDNTGIDDQDIAFDATKWSIIPLPLSITSTPVTCNGDADGTVTATPEDELPPYQFQWNTTPISNDSIVTGLNGGNYTVTVTNGIGTTMTASVSVFEPDILSVNPTVIDPDIAGFSTGEIILDVTGGTEPYTYTWSPDISNNNSATSLNAGNYRITVSDNNSCSQTLDITLYDPECNASYNLSETNITHATADLSWSAVTNAVGYFLRYRKVGSEIWTDIFVENAVYILTGLTPETNYEWEVSTICSEAQSAYTSSNFTTTTTNNIITYACHGIFTDTGGENEDYSDDENYTFTINPPEAEKITVWFTELDIETDYDTLFVYDGASTSDPLLTSYQDIYINSSTETQGICIHSTGDAITFHFQADYATTNPGWVAEWTSYGSSCGNNPNTVVNLETDSDWETEDFVVNFTNTDYSTLGINKAFWQALYLDTDEWKANHNEGMLNYNFQNNLNDWTNLSGTWEVQEEHLVQTDESNTNTNLNINIDYNNSPILIHWQMKINGSGTNRRAGLHFMCDDASQTNRNNSYMVYFRADGNKVQLYKCIDNGIDLITNDEININASQWYDCKIYFNPDNGEIKAFLDNELVSAWTDDSPLTTTNSISLRNGECIAWYDDIKVYTESNTTETVSTSIHLNDVENPNNLSPACKIKSIIFDNLYHFSNLEGSEVNIDLTPPTDIEFVYDGSDTDIESFTENTIEANWTDSQDPNSEVSHYEIAVGSSSGDTDIYEWTDIGYCNNVTIEDITMFTDAQTYYVGIRAINYANLIGNATWSNGQTYIAMPVANFTTPNTNVCEGGSIGFTDITTNNPTNWEWTFDGGNPATSNEQNPIVTYNNEGTYQVVLTSTNTNGEDTETKSEYITVYPTPDINIPETANACTNQEFSYTLSNTYDYILWSDETTESTFNATYTEEGEQQIWVTVGNENCESTDSMLIIVSVCAINNNNLNTNDIVIYPNPTSNVCQLYVSNYTGNLSYDIIDIQGKVIISKRFIVKSEINTEINLKPFKKGIYFIRLTSDNETINFKLIKN